MKRKLFLASSISAACAGCSPIGTALNNSQGFRRLLESAEGLDHAVIGTRGLARLYNEGDVDTTFRVNGFSPPADQSYVRMMMDGSFVQARRRRWSAGAVRSRWPSWSIWASRRRSRGMIAWKAECHRQVERRTFSRRVRCESAFRCEYVVFHCLDNDGQAICTGASIFTRPTTCKRCWQCLNDALLDAAHGAPVRLRVPTQLGYKSAKWVSRIELGRSYAQHLRRWRRLLGEYQDYEWYAGI